MRVITIFRVSKTLDSIFGVPKTLGLIFRGQQRNSGMVERVILKVREYPPWADVKVKLRRAGQVHTMKRPTATCYHPRAFTT